MTESIEWIPLSAQVKPGSQGEFLVSEVPLLDQRKRPVTTLDQPLQDLWPRNHPFPSNLEAKGFTTARDILDLSAGEFSKLDQSVGIKSTIERYVQRLAILPQVITLSRVLNRESLPVFPEHEQEVMELIAFGLSMPIQGVRLDAKTDLWKQVIIDHDGLNNGIQIPIGRLTEELARSTTRVNAILMQGTATLRRNLMKEFADEHDKHRRTLISWRILPIRSIGRIALRQSFVRQLDEFKDAKMVLSDSLRDRIDRPVLDLGWQDAREQRSRRDTAEKFFMVHQTDAQGNSTTTVPLDGLLALDLDAFDREEMIQVMDAAETAIADYRDPDKRRDQQIATAFADRQNAIDITDEEIEEQGALGNKLIPEVVFGDEDFTALSKLKLAQVIKRLGRELDDLDDQGRPRREDIAYAEWAEGLSRYSLYELEDLLNAKRIETFGDLLAHSRPELAEILDGRLNNEVKRMIWEVLAFPNEFDSLGNYFQNIAKYIPPGQTFFSLFKNARFIGEEIRSDFVIYRELQ